MKPSSTFTSSFSTGTVIYTFYNDHTTPIQPTEIPIQSPSNGPPIPITVHLPSPHSSSNHTAAVKIQSAYRAHVIRTLYNIISSVNSEADELQSQIQRQETVDAIRSNEREKLRMNEALMALLLRLDSVPGVDPTVRDARRKVSRRIVGLQEILDAICDTKVIIDGDDGWLDIHGRFLRDWDEVVAGIEEEVCRDRGGEEMEAFCAQYLGFRCLQRFLREP